MSRLYRGHRHVRGAPETAHVRVDLPPEVWREIRAEALRLDRGQSWLLQLAWKLARDELRSLPTTKETP